MKNFIFLLSILPTFLSAQINFQWAGSFAGNNGANSTNDLVVNKNGHVYSTGSFVLKTDFNPSQNVADTFFLNGSPYYTNIFVSRLNASGQHVWTKEIEGNSQNVGKSIAIDQNGNLYVTGVYNGSTDFDPGSAVASLTNTGCFVLKLDSAGNFIWVKEFKGAFSGSVSGNSIEVDKLGNVIVGGEFANTVDFDPGTPIINLINIDSSKDGFICKLDNNGNFMWVKHIQSSVVQSNVCDNQNNVYSCGIFSGTIDFNTGVGTETITTQGQTDVFIIKHDANGNYVWTKTVGGIADESVGAITLDVNQNIYLAGGFSNKVDFNPSTALADTFKLSSNNQKDVFVLKLNNTGNFILAKSFGNGTGVAEAKDIAVDKFENIYTIGQFANTCDFDPNSGTSNLNASGNDMFISKLSNLGNYMSAVKIGGNNSNDFAKAMKLDTLGNIYFCGSFFQVVDFNPTVATYTLNALGYDDGFVAKYGQTGFVGLKELIVDAESISVYPNPAHDQLTLKTDGFNIENFKVEIINTIGQTVFKTEVNTNTLDVSDLKRGIYFITLKNKNNHYSGKFIKE